MVIANLDQTTTLRRYLLPEVRPSDLARRAGVSRQYVSAVLLGQRPPSERLLKAASELGVPVVAEETNFLGVARQEPQSEPDGVMPVADASARGGGRLCGPSPISVQAPSASLREGNPNGSPP
jgi:transcriptional regulator with XRE-family HTH domain